MAQTRAIGSPRLSANIGRDREITERLKKDGWSVLRLWESEVQRELDRVVASVIYAVLCQNSALLKDHGCNLMHRKVLASFYQHLMAEAPMRSV